MTNHRSGPRRIVSLLASGTEILYGLGLGDRVVGISHECNYPSAVAGKPRVTSARIDVEATSAAIDQQVRTMSAQGKAMYAIDVALLASLLPELIVTQAHCEVCAVSYDDVIAITREHETLRDVPVIALNPCTLNDVFDDIVRVGDATGTTTRAANYVQELRDRIENVRSNLREIPHAEQPRTICLEWTDPPIVAANWMPELVELAGGRNGITKSGDRSGYTDWNEVIVFDPEVIIVMPCGFDADRSAGELAILEKLPRWKELSAVRAARVFPVDGDALFNRSGPRLVDSLELLAHLLHPDKVPTPAGGLV